MPTLDEIKDWIETLPERVEVVLHINLTLDGLPEPAPEPAPEPEPDTVRAVVSADKTLARFAAFVNAKGRPVMAIWPSDTSKPDQRVKFIRGAVVQVYPSVITADGGGEYYRLLGLAPDGATTLYVARADVDLDE